MAIEITSGFVTTVISVAGLAVTTLATKCVRAAPLINEVWSTIKKKIEYSQDGILTTEEKAELYEEIVGDIKAAWQILTGITWFKTSDETTVSTE